MKKHFFAKTAALFFAGIAVFASFAMFYSQKIAAQNTTSTDVIVKVLGQKPSIQILEPRGNFATKNDNFDMKIEVEGAGVITIFDQKGRELFRSEKTDPTREILNPKIKFAGDPGEYIFTAKILTLDDEFATAQVKVLYEATRIPIVAEITEKIRGKIAPPNTGNYAKVFGKSFLLQEIFLTFGIFVVIFGAVIFLAKKLRKSPQTKK